MMKKTGMFAMLVFVLLLIAGCDSFMFCVVIPIVKNITATCEQDGTYDVEYKCAICGRVKKTKTFPMEATGHQPSTEAVREATCTEDGITEGTVCTICGKVLSGCETIPAKGHALMEVPVREATCTEGGITEGIVCTICGEVLSGCTIIKAEGHNPTLVEGYPATRERDGLTDGFQCSTCGAMLIEQMPIVIPHTADQNKPYVPVALDGITYEVGPTGRIQISIWADGKQEVRKGLKINHKNESLGKTFTLFSRTVTCEKDGMSEYVTVENSDGSRDSQLGPIEIKALGHSYGSWTEEQGDCQTASSRFRTCSRCGHEDRQTQGKAGHNWAANGENYEEEVDGFVVWGHYEECSVCHEQRRIEDGREKLIVED